MKKHAGLEGFGRSLKWPASKQAAELGWNTGHGTVGSWLGCYSASQRQKDKIQRWWKRSQSKERKKRQCANRVWATWERRSERVHWVWQPGGLWWWWKSGWRTPTTELRGRASLWTPILQTGGFFFFNIYVFLKNTLKSTLSSLQALKKLPVEREVKNTEEIKNRRQEGFALKKTDIWPMILKKMRWRIEKRDRGVSSRLSYCEGEITAGGISESFLETGEHSCYIPLDQSSWKPRSSSKGPAVNHRTWVTQTEPLLGQSWPAPSPPSPTPNRLCWANGTLSDS